MIIVYYKGGNLEVFQTNLHRIFTNRGTVLVIVEPGDATHYEFLIVDLVSQSRMLVSSYVDGWARNIGHGEIVPWYLTENIRFPVSPYTSHLFTDIINMAQGYASRFYDWERSEPCDPTA